jgi:hypothetical protein
VSVIVLVNFPTLFVAYFTFIFSVTPGAIGSRGQVGTVQPHEPFAFLITNGSEPLFVKTNSLLPSEL